MELFCTGGRGTEDFIIEELHLKVQADQVCFSFMKCVLTSGGSTYKSFRRAPPPQQDQILLFLHMFSPKSACVGGWRPLQRGLAPPQREVLDPPLLTFYPGASLNCVVELLLQYRNNHTHLFMGGC